MLTRATGKMIVSFILTLISFRILFDDASIIIWLTVSLLVHEGGHVLLLRHYGITNIPLTFMPFLGAFVAISSGDRKRLTDIQYGIVTFAGPLASMTLVALSLLMYQVAPGKQWLLIATINALLSAINLLGLAMLDGKKIIQSLFWWIPRVGLGWYSMSMITLLSGCTILFFSNPPNSHHYWYLLFFLMGFVSNQKMSTAVYTQSERKVSICYSLGYILLTLTAYLATQLLPNWKMILQSQQ